MSNIRNQFQNFLLDTSKHGARVTPETPLVLKASPKAQWPLQRYSNFLEVRIRLPSFSFRLVTWPEVRMSVGYSFLSQGHRPVSASKTHSKDDWLRQVK